MEKEPDNRMTLEEAMQHPWLKIAAAKPRKPGLKVQVSSEDIGNAFSPSKKHRFHDVNGRRTSEPRLTDCLIPRLCPFAFCHHLFLRDQRTHAHAHLLTHA